MEPGAVALVVTIAIVMLLFYFMRGRGGVRHRPEVVQFLLFDVKMNQALLEVFHERDKVKMFERTNWEINKPKISFLSDELRETLRATFAMVEELNRELKIIKKNRMLSHREMDVSGLNEPLAKCREGLEAWLMDALGTLDVAPRYPSLTGFLFGER